MNKTTGQSVCWFVVPQQKWEYKKKEPKPPHQINPHYTSNPQYSRFVISDTEEKKLGAVCTSAFLSSNRSVRVSLAMVKTK
jgi:hypothetical protein